MGIKEIAKEAGVSISTVSRILNGTKPVSPEMRSRVEAIISEKGYVPNHAARSMVMKRTRTAGLIIPKVSFLYHQEIARYIENEMEAAGYRLIIGSVRDEADAEISYVRLMKEKKVDGIILMHESQHRATIELLENAEISVVLSSVHIPNTKHPIVGIDEFRATYDGTSFLSKLGHSKIGYIGGPGPFLKEHRFEGYRAALNDHGLPFVEANVEDGSFTMEGGRKAATQLLRRSPDVTALFVVSDEMAIGAIRAANDLGYRVPKDVSVLGFDGIQMGAYVVPSLSTVHQPIDEIGTRAARMLLRLMEGTGTPVQSIVVPHRIVSRESCAPISS